MNDAETLSETNEFEGLEEHFHNPPDAEPLSIGADEREATPFSEEKEILGHPDTKDNQPESLTTSELVLQELAKSGRGEGHEIKEGQGTYRLNEDGTELINVETKESYTKMIEKSGDEEAIAMHHEMLQQWREGGDTIFINKEQPDDKGSDTMHGSYMRLNPDGSISWGETVRKIERSEEDEVTERWENEPSAENRWAAAEHTEHQMIQSDSVTEALAQLAATQEADASRPDMVDAGGGEESGEQTAVVAIETLAFPTVDVAETTAHEVVETGNVLVEVVEVAHDPGEAEVVSISEFLQVDSLESLPVFETQETIAHVPEAIVPDATSSQTPQILDIRETSIYQAIIAFLKNDAEATHVSEKPDVETITERVEEVADSHPIFESREAVAEDAVVLPIENGVDTAPLEAQSQTTEIAQATGSTEMTTTQNPLAEAQIATSRVEEKIDIATILRDSDNNIQTPPEIVPAADDRKIDETESSEVRPEASGRQPVLTSHEIFLRTLGIREKTIATREERPYNNILRAGNPTIQLSGTASKQSRGRTLSSNGINLIEV